ncbi:MAG TPA: F0F1 ATP synthase subunit epsilon [Coleofasciculaceae cyanobacterium]
MRLKVLLPTEILLDEAVVKVNAEAKNGCFCLLPHHINFVTALAPGILSFVSTDGQETFLAVDEGILVKCGVQVLVSTRNAVLSTDLKQLKQTIEQRFRRLDEQEKNARLALTKLEANIVRQFIERRNYGQP